MKQYLTTEQTNRLRSLGYPARIHYCESDLVYKLRVPKVTYTVGDLLEFLPVSLGFSSGENPVLRIRKHNSFWKAGYSNLIDVQKEELIDALFELAYSNIIAIRSKSTKR